MTGADVGGSGEAPDGRQLAGVGRRFTARALDFRRQGLHDEAANTLVVKD